MSDKPITEIVEALDRRIADNERLRAQVAELAVHSIPTRRHSDQAWREHNERLRAENARLNLECDELRAALASINEAASRILSEPGNDTGVLITICTIADKALAEKPAPESDKENHEDRH